MSESQNNTHFPKKIKVKIEPVEEPLELLVEASTTVEEIVEKIVEICKERNIDIKEWASDKLGTDKFHLLFMRKGLLKE
jgi:hypothetical protein